MENNLESILDALNDFEKKPHEVSPLLENYLLKIAKTGNIIFPWSKVKPLLKKKLELVLDEFCEQCPPNTVPTFPNTENFNYDSLKSAIMDALDNFPNAPFTIQRLCELVTNPKKHYSRTDKYMRGIEKNILVVSTIGFTSLGDSENNQNQFAVVNGSVGGSNSPPNETAYDGDHYDSSDMSQLSNVAPKSVNGTVLDNFASVFPTAPCITPSKNSMINMDMCDNRMYESNVVNQYDFSHDVNSNSISPNCEVQSDLQSIDSNVGTETVMSDENNSNSENCSNALQSAESSYNTQYLIEECGQLGASQPSNQITAVLPTAIVTESSVINSPENSEAKQETSAAVSNEAAESNINDNFYCHEQNDGDVKNEEVSENVAVNPEADTSTAENSESNTCNANVTNEKGSSELQNT